MARDHQFVDAESVVVVPRTKSRGEREREQWAEFAVMPYHDHVVVDAGHPLDSLYVEMFWLPVIGPASLWMARNLLRREPGSTVLATELAGELGINVNSCAHTLTRLHRFGVILPTSRHVLVRTHLAPLSLQRFGNLPPHLRIKHSAYVEPEHREVLEQ